MCQPEDFRDNNGIDVLIQKLARPLDCPQFVALHTLYIGGILPFSLLPVTSALRTFFVNLSLENKMLFLQELRSYALTGM